MKDNCFKKNCFIDTNLLVYAYDESDQDKKKKSMEFLKRIKEEEDPVISTQSLGEFYNVAIKKLKFSKDDAISVCNEFANFYSVYEIRTENVFHAMNISKQTQFSYWDSLIIAMAIDTGCFILYSEDLNDGQEIEGVRIVNPFA